MNCNKITPLLERYVDNELRPDDRTQVEAHLTACPDCSRVVREFRELQSLLRSEPLVTKPESYWSDLADRFWQAWNQRRRAHRREAARPLPFFSIPRLIALGATAVLLVTVGVISLRSVHTILPSGSAKVEYREADTSKITGLAQDRIERPGDVAGIAAQKRKEGARTRASSETEALTETAPEPTRIPEKTPPEPVVPGMAAPVKGGGAGAGEDRARMYAAAKPPEAAKPPAAKGTAVPKGDKTETEQEPAPIRMAAKVAKGVGQPAQPAPDTAAYPESQLDSRPRLISIPDLPDSIRQKYAGLQVAVWVIVERDGTVSRAELRTALAVAGLAPIILKAARQARFVPGKIDDKPVRASTLITVKIRSRSEKNE